jgi:hypothetical protein
VTSFAHHRETEDPSHHVSRRSDAWNSREPAAHTDLNVIIRKSARRSLSPFGMSDAGVITCPQYLDIALPIVPGEV